MRCAYPPRQGLHWAAAAWIVRCAALIHLGSLPPPPAGNLVTMRSFRLPVRCFGFPERLLWVAECRGVTTAGGPGSTPPHRRSHVAPDGVTIGRRTRAGEQIDRRRGGLSVVKPTEKTRGAADECRQPTCERVLPLASAAPSRRTSARRQGQTGREYRVPQDDSGPLYAI